jgi:hypothetical protein
MSLDALPVELVDYIFQLVPVSDLLDGTWTTFPDLAEPLTRLSKRWAASGYRALLRKVELRFGLRILSFLQLLDAQPRPSWRPNLGPYVQDLTMEIVVSSWAECRYACMMIVGTLSKCDQLKRLALRLEEATCFFLCHMSPPWSESFNVDGIVSLELSTPNTRPWPYTFSAFAYIWPSLRGWKNLRSVRIGFDAITSWIVCYLADFPKLTELILFNVCDALFVTPDRFEQIVIPRLRHLELRESRLSFFRAFLNSPLEVLVLHWSDEARAHFQCDYPALRWGLRYRWKALERLDLKCVPLIADEIRHLPPSLTQLTIVAHHVHPGPPDLWLQRLSDSRWLPRLQFLSISLRCYFCWTAWSRQSYVEDQAALQCRTRGVTLPNDRLFYREALYPTPVGGSDSADIAPVADDNAVVAVVG